MNSDRFSYLESFLKTEVEVIKTIEEDKKIRTLDLHISADVDNLEYIVIFENKINEIIDYINKE